MSFRACFRILAIILITGVPVFAQALPTLPGNLSDFPPISLDEADQHLIDKIAPEYPPIAKAARVEGDVRLTIEVDTLGNVIKVVHSSGHPLLIGAATAAAEKYRYRPFVVNGIPSRVLVDTIISFSLGVKKAFVPFPEVTDIKSVVMEYDDGFIGLRISGSGEVEYNGKYNAAVEGKHEYQIGPEDIQNLLDAYRKADFFSLSDDYVAGATDVGLTTTSIQVGTLRKIITDDWVAVPPSLKEVKIAILKYSHSDQWAKGNLDTITGLFNEISSPLVRKTILSQILPRVALYGDTAAVTSILANKVDLERRGPYGNTALMLAADRGLPDMVAALLKAGAKPHTRDKDGRGALIFGAGSGNAEVVRLLLAAGLKGSEKDKYGDTALMAAAASGNPECVRLLLAHGARVNAKNKRRQTALISAASGDPGFSIGDSFRNHAEVPEELIHRDTTVKLLLDAGADINVRGWDGETALFSLEDDAVRELIKHHINLEIRDNYGQTALIETVSDSTAELLINAGARLNAQDSGGRTALIMAAENNETEKLKVLLKTPGVDLEVRDNKGETALMKAKAKHFEDCVSRLLAAGAT